MGVAGVLLAAMVAGIAAAAAAEDEGAMAWFDRGVKLIDGSVNMERYDEAALAFRWRC